MSEGRVESKCDKCPIDVEIRRNTHCCERCTKEHPAYEIRTEAKTSGRSTEYCSKQFLGTCEYIKRLEAEHKKEMDEFGRQNEALAVVCADLKEQVISRADIRTPNDEALEGENKKLHEEFNSYCAKTQANCNHCAVKHTEKIKALEGRLSAIDLFMKKLNQKYAELLKGEQDNYSTAMAMDTCAEKSDLLSHSWGRIKLLKDILRGLGVLLNPPKKLDQKPVCLLMDELASCCGFLSSESQVNNYYNCTNPEQTEKEFDEKLKKDVGKCLRCSCPVAMCVDGHDLMEVFDEALKHRIVSTKIPKGLDQKVGGKEKQ